MAPRPLTLEELDAEAIDYDRAVADSGEHAHFCSSADWVLPAARGLMPGKREPWLFRGESGYLAFMRGLHPRGFAYAEPLEAYWGLACPLVGTDPGALVSELAEVAAARRADWDVLVLSGVVESSRLFEELRRRLGKRYRVAVTGTTARYVADLSGGLEGFLSRRTANARRSLRKSYRAVLRAGVSFEAPEAGDPEALLSRILAVEARSWKGLTGVGITEAPMRDFYQLMVPRLVRDGRLRLLFARREDRDVGYILGAMFGDRYRGLQFSFDDRERPLAIGNALQLAQIERLGAEGAAEYDLGATGGHYKTRWADRPIPTAVLLAIADP